MSLPDATNLSESMRPIRKYIVQAKQLDGVQPQVAYLCRLYAAQVGMKFKSTPEDLNFILVLMEWLENNVAIIEKYPTKDDRHTLLDEFAADLFENADNQDRSPQGSTDDTCRTFLAIAILIDVCEHFGELSDASNSIRRYATWKAADIRRSIKSGMRPMAGGPPDIDPFYDPDAAAVVGTAPVAAPVYTPTPVVTKPAGAVNVFPQQPAPTQAPPSHQAPIPQPAQSTTFQPSIVQSPQNTQHPIVPLTATTIGDSMTIKGNMLPREQAMVQVDRLCKHASSAVAFDDTKTAIDKLTQALSLLIPYRDA